MYFLYSAVRLFVAVSLFCKLTEGKHTNFVVGLSAEFLSHDWTAQGTNLQ